MSNLYAQVLGREVDSGSAAHWQDTLGNGLTLGNMRWEVAHSGEAWGRVADQYWQALGRAADGGSMVFWQDALSNGLALHDVRWDVAHSGEAAARIQGLFADAQLQVPHLDGLRQWQDALGLSRSMAFIQQEVTDLRLLTAYEPGNSLPPPGTPIGPFREALVPLDQIPDNARGILQYRAIFYDQTTGKYEIGFSFPLSSGFTSEPAFNQRGEAPGNNEVGIFVLLPESPPFPRGQGLNPRLGIRVGYNYRGTGVPYFRVFNSKGQAISPVTGKTVGAGDSHYPLDILRSLRQSY